MVAIEMGSANREQFAETGGKLMPARCLRSVCWALTSANAHQHYLVTSIFIVF